MTAPTTAVSGATHQVGDHVISDKVVVWLLLGASILSIQHSLLIGLALLPVTVGAVLSWRRWPWLWIAGGALAAILAAFRWFEYQDHVFFGAYQLIAVGIALTGRDFRSSLARQLRWLTGALFAVAVVWKLTASSYRSGDMFRTVLIVDDRFDPLTLSLGSVDESALAAIRDRVVELQTTMGLDAVPLLGMGNLSALAVAMTVWTLVIETVIAISFLSPDHSRWARLRHPSLLMFGITTYLLVPVLSFAVMLAAVGLAQRHRPGVEWLYILMAAGPLLRGLFLAF